MAKLAASAKPDQFLCTHAPGAELVLKLCTKGNSFAQGDRAGLPRTILLEALPVCKWSDMPKARRLEIDEVRIAR